MKLFFKSAFLLFMFFGYLVESGFLQRLFGRK